MIITKHGNLLDVPNGIIVHGCNSRGVMASGIAKEVKERFPKAFQRYRSEYEYYITNGDPHLPLGSITMHWATPNKAIINAITQRDYGRDKAVTYVKYEALEIAFARIIADDELISVAKEFGIHFPLIGCGLANGQWEVVEEIIDRIIPNDIEKNLWIFNP